MMSVMGFLFCILPGRNTACRSCRRRSTQWSSTATLNSGIHVTFVIVEDKEEIVSTLNRARKCLQPNVVGSAVACKRDDVNVFLASLCLSF